MRSSLPNWSRRLIAVFLFFLIVAGAIHLLGVAATRSWQRYAASLRAKGEPLTIEEIYEARTPVVDEQNSALVIERLIPKLDALDDARSDSDVLIVGRGSQSVDVFAGIPRHTIEPSRAFLETHRELLIELEALRDRRSGRFVRPITANPWSMLLPELAPLRLATKLVHLNVILELVEGRAESAAAAAVLEFRLAGTLDQDVTIIGRLVQIAIQAMSCRSLEDILRAGELDVDILEDLDTELVGQLDSSTMRWALRGERAFHIAAFEQMLVGAMSPTDILSVSSGGGVAPQLVPKVLLRRNQAKAAAMLGWLVDAGDDCEKLRSAARKLDTEIPRLSRLDFIVKIMQPSLSRAMELHVKIVAQLRCARAALAAERYRLAKGSFPTALTELVPEFLDELPIDPFNGQPMLLIQNEEGIVIYSVGADEVDDGGLVAAKKPPQDVGFRLVRPELRGIVILDDPKAP